MEGSSTIITTNNLSAIDYDSEPATLKFIIDKPPREGVITLRGKSIKEFTQADIAAGVILYDHTSANEDVNSDEFLFSVTDGVNSDQHSFSITIVLVNDRIPVLSALGTLQVQEGVAKAITEFELLAKDEDTKVDTKPQVYCQFMLCLLHLAALS